VKERPCSSESVSCIPFEKSTHGSALRAPRAHRDPFVRPGIRAREVGLKAMTSFRGLSYLLEAKITEGAFGVVVKASSGGRVLAAKIFEEEEFTSLSDDEEETTMSPTALRELSFMQLLTELRAPRCVPVLDFGFELGEYLAPVIYMPLYEGDVAGAISEKRLADAERLRVACDLLTALEFLHGCEPPIAHRDVKPENVLLDREGAAFLTDFSFACFTSEYRAGLKKKAKKKRQSRRRSEKDPEHSGLLGTETYISPELLEGAFPHPSADAWAAGVTLLELLENRRLPVDDDEEALRFLRKKRAALDGGLLFHRVLRDLLEEAPLRRLTVRSAVAQLRAAALCPEAERRPAVLRWDPVVVSEATRSLCSSLGAVVPETCAAAERYRRSAPDLDARLLAAIAVKMHEHRPRSDEELAADIEALENAQELLLRRLGGCLLGCREAPPAASCCCVPL
jgi:serine/threonine protein kinase